MLRFLEAWGFEFLLPRSACVLQPFHLRDSGRLNNQDAVDRNTPQPLKRQTTSSVPAASILVVLRAAQKTAQGGIGRKSVGAGRLTRIEDLPPRKTRARVLRSANPQKDNSNMTARATRRIGQPDSYHSAPNGSATTRATFSIATSHSDTTACAASSAQVVNKRRGRHPATTACAASPAQVLGVSASASCGAQTHKGQLKWLRKLKKLIGGTAIRSRANRRRFSDLQISNRQQKEC